MVLKVPMHGLSPKKKGGNVLSALYKSQLLIIQRLVHIVEVLQRWTNLLQVLFFHQNPCKHFHSIILFLWTTKDQFHFLFLPWGINKLFHMNRNSYPTTKTPWRPTQQLHMIPLRNWTKLQGMISQGNIFYFPISPSQKPRNSHKCSRYYLFKMEKIMHLSSQDPQSYHTHELPHNHYRNP
jgi:hypothetical protein